MGQDAADILIDLLLAAGGNPRVAQMGIVYLDEIDKIATETVAYKDVSGRGVQKGLLHMVDGTENTVHIGKERIMKQQHPRAAVVKLVFQLGRGKAPVQGHEDRPQLGGREIGLEELDAVQEHNSDSIAFANSSSLKQVGAPIDSVVQLLVRDRLILEDDRGLLRMHVGPLTGDVAHIPLHGHRSRPPFRARILRSRQSITRR